MVIGIQTARARIRWVEAGTEMQPTFYHRPVMFKEALEALAVKPGGVYVDCTVGEGGHALGILQASRPGGRLLGIDLDPRALEAARERLRAFESSFALVRGSYASLAEIAASAGLDKVDGVLFDLGLSSLQLEGERRGFSFLRDEPLDMRFDPSQALTAADIVNTYRLEELADIIHQYGEEPRARAIARAIVQRRPIKTARELAQVVALAAGARRGGIHPATRTFQALRIAVNGELENLERGLAQAIQILRPGGRLVTIAYHSLEDRLVKRTFAREASTCICPPGVPVCTCQHKPTLKVLSKRVITPSPEEVNANPRSRSARMRVAERL